MEPYRLLQQWHARGFPRSQIIEENVQLGLDLIRRRTKVELPLAERARPCPDRSEHFLVQTQSPRHIEPRDPPVRCPGQILHGRLADVLRLGDVELGLGTDALVQETRDVIQRRLSGQCGFREHQADQSLREDPARSSW